MRCIACNRRLNAFELTMVKSDGTPEDLCGDCRSQISDDIMQAEYYRVNEEEEQFQDNELYSS